MYCSVKKLVDAVHDRVLLLFMPFPVLMLQQQHFTKDSLIKFRYGS